jgi:hypothetical protein
MASAVSALLRPLLRALTPLHEASACHLLASAVSLLLQQYQEAVAATGPATAARRAVAAATSALVSLPAKLLIKKFTFPLEKS